MTESAMIVTIYSKGSGGRKYVWETHSRYISGFGSTQLNKIKVIIGMYRLRV